MDAVQIGQAIKDLRKKQNITGEELGRKAGMSQPKISKIENGFYPRPDHDEIARILNILNAPSTIRQQLLRGIEEKQNRPRMSFYGFTLSMASTELERRSRVIKIYTANAIPALLQTTDYRRGSLEYKGVTGEELDRCIKNTLTRQDMLWDSKHRFHMIIPQSSLYTTATPVREHLAQLDRLERAMNIPNVKFGIIPVEAGHVLIEYSSFALYDDHTIIQALGRGEITSQNKQDVKLHSEVFSSLNRLTYYDADAVKLIRKAMTYFS